MKNQIKYLKSIFCVILISFTAVGTYSYFTFGELYYGKFLDSAGNVIADRGNGKSLTDTYIYYKEVDSQAVILPAQSLSITITNTDDNSQPRSNFVPISVIYQINNRGWDDNNKLINPSINNGKYTFTFSNFTGGSVQFKILAIRNNDDGTTTTVATNAFRLTACNVILKYYGTNEYLGCKNFKLTNVSIVGE